MTTAAGTRSPRGQAAQRTAACAAPRTRCRGRATLDETLAEWKAYLGTRNFTLLHQILDQLREITDPYAR